METREKKVANQLHLCIEEFIKCHDVYLQGRHMKKKLFMDFENN